MSTSPEPFIPEGLMPINTSLVMAKIKSFTAAGAENLHMVYDFDRTLTVARDDTKEDITTWHILQKHLPPEGRARYLALFETYRPMEMEGKMELGDAVAWWSQILDLFAKHHVNMAEVEQDFLAKVALRPGTSELFELSAAYGIPTVILSAGVKDIIELWAQTYNIKPSVILATDLILGVDRRVVGWNEATLVHTLNKKERGHSELSKLSVSRPFSILLGDAESDADMADGEETVLRVLMHNPRPDETINTKFPNNFDLVCTTSDFTALTRLLKQIVATPG